MKKNKWLLMLAAITLLATCLFAGLAVADDAGTGTAIDDTDLTVVTFPVTWQNNDTIPRSATFDVDLKFLGTNRATSNDPFVAPAGTWMGEDNYYSGKIKVAYVPDNPVASLRTDGNVSTIYIALYYKGMLLSQADAKALLDFGDDPADDLYFYFSSAKDTIIYPERATKAAQWGRLVSIDELINGNELTLNFMSKHELLPVLYKEGPVLTGAGMFPGTTPVTVQLYWPKENNTTLADGHVFTSYSPWIAVGKKATLNMNVNVMKWTGINYEPGHVVSGYDSTSKKYVIYLDHLQDDHAVFTDIGYEFPLNSWSGLGTFTIEPDYATYQKLHFEIEGTDVANIRSDFSKIVIKKTGTFTLIVTDESKTSDVVKKIDFIVKDETGSYMPVMNANFTYDRFDRKVGEYINLNRYVYLTRKALTKIDDMPAGTIFKQNLIWRGSTGTKDAKYATEYYTDWVRDQYNRSYVDEPAERFHIRWKSSNTDVALVVNAEDIYYDVTSPWTIWHPTNSYWDFQQTGTTTAPLGARLTWYSKTDRTMIYPSQGYVALVGTGKATITVEVVNYGEDKTVYRASTTIYVKDREGADENFADDPEEVEDILVSKISAKKVTLKVGDKQALAYTVKPANATNQKVSFSSSNTKIVKINSKGVMTARKVGTAYITITAKDGSGVSKTVKVTVK